MTQGTISGWYPFIGKSIIPSHLRYLRIGVTVD